MTEPIELRPLRQPLDGDVVLPGDKSISHRAFLLNALGEGTARVSGCNQGADLRSTRACLRSLGVQIVRSGDAYRVEGRGGRLRCPSEVLECGNSGTTMRLLAGLLAAQEFTATLDGDASLRNRPMARVAQPLRRMGARVEGPDNGSHPPLIVTGASLKPSEFDLNIASAQLKSCLLIAAATGGTPLRVREPHLSRDHSERMFAAMGAAISLEDGWIALTPGKSLRCVDVDVPGDPSALALVASALCALPGSRLRARDVLLNPTRAAFLDVLERAGFEVSRERIAQRAGEPVGDVVLRSPDQIRPIEIPTESMPSMIDEIPALAVVAALASGRSSMHGVAELRLKESDRIAGIESLLGSFGVACSSDEESLWIEGGLHASPLAVDAGEDHRMVMAAVALGLCAATRTKNDVRVNDLRPAAVSFPGFRDTLSELGADLA